jgi:TRAP-type C4-dicarboxylate transport system permease small subunit
MMKKITDGFFKLMELGVVLCLFAMVIMVFGNVIMRYFFNSGILISEELSRYAFVWLTYLGAMVAMRTGGHLGVDTMLKHLPLAGKKFCVFLSESLMLFVNCMFLWGTYKMHDLQVTNVSPVAGLSMIWIYGLGYLVAVVMGIFNINKLYLLLTGQLTEEQMVQVVEAEGLQEVERDIEQLKKA